MDQEMSAIRDEIIDAQEKFKIKATLVSDVLNNIRALRQQRENRYARSAASDFTEWCVITRWTK